MHIPEWLHPMAATLTAERFAGLEWIFERKLDGIRMLVELRAQLEPFRLSVPPFARGTGLPRARVHWVKPAVVVQVAFTEWTVHGKLRHPRLLGIREDKAAADATRES